MKNKNGERHTAQGAGLKKPQIPYALHRGPLFLEFGVPVVRSCSIKGYNRLVSVVRAERGFGDLL